MVPVVVPAGVVAEVVPVEPALVADSVPEEAVPSKQLLEAELKTCEQGLPHDRVNITYDHSGW